jgi:hypothetical protein
MAYYREREEFRKLHQTYRYEPAGMDLFYDHAVDIPAGTIVRKVQPVGCPRNGTMRMAYVETLDGVFVGLRNLASLVPVRRAHG